TPYNPIAVNTGQRLVVIDTGLGEAGFNATKGVNGQFLTNLAAAGIDANAVDAVIISHYHGDHVNGLLKADNSLAFPNAEILVPAAEHKFWMDDGEMSRAPKGRMEDLFKNNRRVFAGEVMKRLRTYDEGKEVVPGITAVGTHGHSAGHNSHVVASGSSQVYVQADVTHVPFLFARNPGWHAFYDQDPIMAEETRRNRLRGTSSLDPRAMTELRQPLASERDHVRPSRFQDSPRRRPCVCGRARLRPRDRF